MTDEKEIIEQALNALRKETADIAVQFEPAAPQRFNQDTDGFVYMRGTDREGRRKYQVEVKRAVTKPMIGLLRQRRQHLNPMLLITNYVPLKMAERLQQAGINFIDTAGNAYIDAPPLCLINIRGNRQPDFIKKQTGPRAFNRAGVLLVFALLCDKKLVNGTMREIAETAGVAVGTVNAVFNDLERKGFLVKIGDGRRHLDQKEKLVAQWVIAYPDVLRPKIIIGKYKADDKWRWQNTELPKQAKWGGEPAAAIMTKYLKPEEITIYAPELPKELIIQQRMRKDPKGEITILKTFWTQNLQWENKNNETVHPLIVYADLLATGDSRNIETANKIYEDEITRYI